MRGKAIFHQMRVQLNFRIRCSRRFGVEIHIADDLTDTVFTLRDHTDRLFVNQFLQSSLSL